MSEKDIKFKQYADDNRRFADLVNYVVYKGQRVVKADQLKPVNIEEAIIIKAKNDRKSNVTGQLSLDNRKRRGRWNAKWQALRAKPKFRNSNVLMKVNERGKRRENVIVTRIRDLFKFVTVKKAEKNYYAFIGLEEQSSYCSVMAVRCMLYDALAYINQSKGNLTKQFSETAKMPKSRLVPVITIVVNFSDKAWSAPKSLYEMMPELPDELKAFVPDYHINLIDPLTMGEDDYQLFETHWGAIFEAYKVYIDKGMQACYPYIRTSDRMKDVSLEDIEFLEAMTGYEMPMYKGEKGKEMNAHEKMEEILKLRDLEVIEEAKPKIIEEVKPKIIEEVKPKIIEDINIQTARRMFELNQGIDLIQKTTLLPLEKLLTLQEKMNS